MSKKRSRESILADNAARATVNPRRISKAVIAAKDRVARIKAAKAVEEARRSCSASRGRSGR